MLVLSRKIGERVVIGADLVVTVIGMRGRQVCLGLEAPENVGIWREEVLRADAAPISNETARIRP